MLPYSSGTKSDPRQIIGLKKYIRNSPSRCSQRAQEEKANMAKQMAQMQAQLAHLLDYNSSSDAPMPDPAASSEQY